MDKRGRKTIGKGVQGLEIGFTPFRWRRCRELKFPDRADCVVENYRRAHLYKVVITVPEMDPRLSAPHTAIEHTKAAE